MKTEMDHWLENCPETVITNIESRTPLDYLALSAFLYPSDTHIFTSLSDLREMYEKLTVEKDGTNESS